MKKSNRATNNLLYTFIVTHISPSFNLWRAIYICLLVLLVGSQAILASATPTAYPQTIYTAPIPFEKTIQVQGKPTIIKATITYQFDPSFYKKERRSKILSPTDAPIMMKRAYTQPEKYTDYIKLRRIINEKEAMELKSLVNGSKDHISKYEPKFLDKFDETSKQILDHYSDDIKRQGELFVFYCPENKSPQKTTSWTIIANIGLNIREKYGYKEILDVNGFHRFRGNDAFLATVIKPTYGIHGMMRMVCTGFFHFLFAESTIREHLKSWTDIHNKRANGSLVKMGFTQTGEFSESTGRCQENQETFKKCQWEKYLLPRQKFYEQYPTLLAQNIQQEDRITYPALNIRDILLHPTAIATYATASVFIVSGSLFVWYKRRQKR